MDKTELKERFEKQYFTVFDKVTGSVRLCGRDACRELMDLCKKYYPEGVFGDKETGIMDIPAIKAVAMELHLI